LLSKTSKETLESEQGKLAIKNATEWARLVTAGWYNGGKERGEPKKIVSFRLAIVDQF